MNFNHLFYIVTAAKAGSINRACQELLISQPYLSGVIKNVEDKLGIQIFQRTQNGIILTDTGKLFIKSAERILSEWDVLQNLKNAPDNYLNIVSYYSYFYQYCFLNMRTVVGSLSHDSFREMPLVDCFRSLSTEQANIALICYADCYKDYYKKMAVTYQCRLNRLFSDIPLCIMLRFNHPLASRKSVTISDLLQYPIVCYKDALPFLKSLGIKDYSDLFIASDRSIYLGAIENDDYISINSVVVDEKFSNPHFHFIPIENAPFQLEFDYAVRNKYNLNQRERQFIRLIRQCEKHI